MKAKIWKLRYATPGMIAAAAVVVSQFRIVIGTKA
jgi:hypothetical protein